MTHNHNIQAASHCTAHQKVDPIWIHHINANVGAPAYACQALASVGVNPRNTKSYDHVSIH